MCGRYALRAPTEHRWLAGIPGDLAVPRYNIAPGQRVAVVGRNPAGGQVVGAAVWGFRPHWLTAERRGPINARAETVAAKPMFRDAFRRGRCLVPADGWYEWQSRDDGPKQPYFFHRPDDGLFWFAGLATTDAAGERTMAILTTDANDIGRPVHARMPVVLDNNAAAATWIDPDAPESTLDGLLAAIADDRIATYPVSREVNRPQNDRPDIVQPLADP